MAEYGNTVIKAAGNNLRNERLRRGLSLDELADKAGMTKSSLSEIERGISHPRPRTAKRLCAAFSMDFDELFTIAEREEVQA
jgi:transcriptional regulator with XRE-family HTH domain